MDTIPENKKLKLIAAAILIIAAGAVGVFYWQKAHIPLDLSPAAVQAKCLEDVGKMTDEQIIEKINALAFAAGEELNKLNQLMYKHLRCQFFENPFEEQFDKTKSLIGAIRLDGEKKPLIFEDLAKHLKAAQDYREDVMRRISAPTFSLIVYTKERLCPDSKENAGLVEKLLENVAKSGYTGTSIEKAQAICSNYCAPIYKYSEDESNLTKEVYEFKDWAKDSLERKFEYRWRVVLASRFGGEAKALEVCNNLSDVAEKKDCQDKVDSLNGWPTFQIRKEGCMGYELKDAIDLICQPRSQ